MARKIIMPTENVEYTFRFPPKKQLVYRWFGDVTEKGRLLLWNLTGKYYTGMTATYFTYLLKNRLVNKKTVADVSDKPNPKEPTVKNEKVAKSVTHSQPIEEKRTELTEQEKADNVRFCDKCINEVRGYSDTEKSYLRLKVVQTVSKEKIGLYDTGRVITDLERLKGDISDEEYSAIISRYFAISETVSSYRARCAALK